MWNIHTANLPQLLHNPPTQPLLNQPTKQPKLHPQLMEFQEVLDSLLKTLVKDKTFNKTELQRHLSEAIKEASKTSDKEDSKDNESKTWHSFSLIHRNRNNKPSFKEIPCQKRASIVKMKLPKHELARF